MKAHTKSHCTRSCFSPEFVCRAACERDINKSLLIGQQLALSSAEFHRHRSVTSIRNRFTTIRCTVAKLTAASLYLSTIRQSHPILTLLPQDVTAALYPVFDIILPHTLSNSLNTLERCRIRKTSTLAALLEMPPPTFSKSSNSRHRNRIQALHSRSCPAGTPQQQHPRHISSRHTAGSQRDKTAAKDWPARYRVCE